MRVATTSIIPAVSAGTSSRAQSQGGGWKTHRPPTIVETTSTDSSSSVGQVNGSRDSTTRSARKPGQEPAAPALVAGEPGGRDGRCDDRLLDRERLVGAPAGPLVDRPQHAGADPGERIELLDRRVGAVDDDRARVPEAPERVGAVEAVAPEPLGQVAVGRSVRELDRAGDAELREARNVGGVEALGVLDPVAQPERLPERPGSPRTRRERRGWRGRRSRARRPASRPAAARADDRPRAPRGS